MGGKKKDVATQAAAASPQTTSTIWQRFLASFRSPQKMVKYSVWSLAVVAVLGLAYLIFALSFVGRVYPNVLVGGQNMAGLRRDQVQQKVQQLTDQLSGTTLTLKSGDHQQSFKPEDLSWHVDVAATTDAVYNYGRTDSSRITSFGEQLISPFIKTDLDPVVSYDQAQLTALVSGFADAAGTPATDASAQLSGGKVVTTSEKPGQVINQVEAKNSLVARLNGWQGGELNTVLITQEPKIILGDQAALQSQVDELSKAELTLQWATGSKKLSHADIRSLIDFIGQGASGASDKQILGASFTAESVQNYLTSISGLTDHPAAEPQLAVNDGVLAITKPSSDGSVVDLKESATAILLALQSHAATPVVLTMKASHPSIDSSNLASLGIKERIGFGQTSMGNSPANRRHNIANGVSLLSGALIKPGDEFSTVTKLGAVDNTTGFLPELVIKDNRTVPDFGGGLCQVSTTLFRSVMNAGLKVTERQNHSYRVSYYEPPIGLDATIYLPKPDFKFLNDTPAYILVQARVVGNNVQFELWGTSDGRTTSISDPVVSNIIQPPATIYTNTDTLPVGTTKLTDHAHVGATAVAVYTVTRNGQVINKQTFKSVYKALPERWLVGTNASLPPPTP